MFKAPAVQAIALTAVLATSSAAQTIDGTASEFLRRSSVSIAVTQTRPMGALGENIGLGYGVSGAYLFRLDTQGILSLRADIAGVQYGNESKRSAFSETVGGRVQVRTRTSNYIFPVTLGPQLAWPTGPVRPYVNAGVGAQAFVTESDVEGVDDSFVIARSTNQSDVTLAWVAGGGITIPIVRGATRAQLDMSMQYVNGGRARYLAPGSIVDLQGGAVRISSLESSTHLLMLRVGARIGL
jgi:opacity protein-like surface antigen